jgi:hypothetical protein
MADVTGWVNATLMRSGAATLCTAHAYITKTGNDKALDRAVMIARMNPCDGLNADESEGLLRSTCQAMDILCPVCTETTRLAG